MRFAVIVMLLSGLLLTVPAASASEGPCDGIVPNATCTVDGIVERCSPPTILSQCYGYGLMDVGAFVIYTCIAILGEDPCT